ncbi:methyl-accepting chemotaxis protein [Mobilitalea sibirica]|uniref:Methyl-accepting chemotaxis protein n=1 Tax=Mobilitalea sibirica TaxID=1462919 RepID=A0A8J7H1B0_9FIRM|nr:methyl-accepting chemotaxis protein [Mobilitalea sibirica]MBH1940097.1 methyl-accepting chemotaxis protein [Mobilitalea sibirica]
MAKRQKSNRKITYLIQTIVRKLSQTKHQANQGTRKKKKNRFKSKLMTRFSGIRAKLLFAFAIPIILMLVYGIVSYNKSSDAIISGYEKSATDTLESVKDYLSIGVDAVASKAYEAVYNETLKNYYNKADEMSNEEEKSNFNAVKGILASTKSSHPFIYAVHAIGKLGSSTSTVGAFPDGIYEGFLESPLGQQIQTSTQRLMWIGNHSYIDEKLENKQTSYSLSIIRKMAENNGFIVVDIQTNEILKSLSKINFAEGSIIGFITADGKETLAEAKDTNVFVDLPYYKALADSKEPSGFSYEEYNGEKYIFLYTKLGDTGAALCALVPEHAILAQANEIRSLNVIFVTIACIIAGIIGTIIAAGIGREITKLSGSIAKAANGDLTTKFETKRKDEFRILSDSLTDMIGGMRKLIEEVSAVGTRVSSSADNLSHTTSDILGSTKNISFAIEEIGKGVVQQATDTEQCSNLMSGLSEKVNHVYDNTNEIEQIAIDTKSIVGEGIVTIDELSKKSSATTDITHVVIDEIEELEFKSRSIEQVISVINDIASQTNLLSLNASIEAARAGEAGRGFAVVAEEIRKLADQSVAASNQIKVIIQDIQTKTQGTVASAKRAESIVESQMEALDKTISTFEDINQHVAKLVHNLDNISQGVKGIEAAKDETMDAISNISAISEETASSSEEVSATAIEQITSVEYLSNSAIKLAEDAKILEEAIRQFKLS